MSGGTMWKQMIGSEQSWNDRRKLTGANNKEKKKGKTWSSEKKTGKLTNINEW